MIILKVFIGIIALVLIYGFWSCFHEIPKNTIKKDYSFYINSLSLKHIIKNYNKCGHAAIINDGEIIKFVKEQED